MVGVEDAHERQALARPVVLLEGRRGCELVSRMLDFDALARAKIGDRAREVRIADRKERMRRDRT